MEEYAKFQNRIGYQQAELLMGEGDFTPRESVRDKVNADNSFKPFYGDTVVFDLDSQTKKRVAAMIDRLYEEAPECFCEKLGESTLHMTLHDLSASTSEAEATAQAAENEAKLTALLKTNPVKKQTIRMKTNFAINMVDISLVLALAPADEGEWIKLQELYSLLDNVKVCGYPFLTPHITLAYYNYNGFNADSLAGLKAVVRELNQQNFELTLDTARLFYQHFTDMNHYTDIFDLYCTNKKNNVI